ncbi:MAG: 6-carboxytetrahydropterin synthase [Lentisphaerae bacterium]|nr:6-carboxytetrahydropterin synthase [Lentisphaerota bacterium]
MPYRICKIIEVESGHMLSKHPANCKFPHGHSRRVEMVLEADELDCNDMVCDYFAVKNALVTFLDSFDHAMCMNSDDAMYPVFKEAYGERIIEFKGEDPTTEAMARMIFDRVKALLADYATRSEGEYVIAPSVRLVRIRLWETASSWAEYEG